MKVKIRHCAKKEWIVFFFPSCSMLHEKQPFFLMKSMKKNHWIFDKSLVVVFGRFSKLSSSSSFELFEFCCCRQGFKDFGILLTLRQISLGHQHALLATPAKVEPTVGWGRRSHAAADAVALQLQQQVFGCCLKGPKLGSKNYS